jgi:hypothetical protein
MAYVPTHAAAPDGQRRAAALGKNLRGCMAPVNDGTFSRLLAILDQAPYTVCRSPSGQPSAIRSIDP